MSRTYDADRILSALIEEYQREGHFIFNKDGKVSARLITPDDDEDDLPQSSKVTVCLTSLADKVAERLSL